MTAAVAAFTDEQAEARTEECCYRCEVCRAVNGVDFTDRIWTCVACAPEVLARLRAEQWQTAGALRKKRKKR